MHAGCLRSCKTPELTAEIGADSGAAAATALLMLNTT
jgi:hypothetical protein